MRGFYFITDRALSRKGVFEDVRSALKAGVEYVQYRPEGLNAEQMLSEALRLRQVCRNAFLIINDRPDIALAVKADGVHLGRGDLPADAARKLLGGKNIIGVTVHNLEEALEAERLGADYLGASPIFSTSTKKNAGRPAGLKLLQEIKERVSIPVAAIGGINISNAADVVSAGADAICAISAVLSTDNVENEIKKFQRLFIRH